MSLVHQHSCECMKSELDLFAVPPTQASIEYGHWVEHRPLSSITDSGPIEFNISGSGDDYLDLNNTFLYLQAKIVTAANDANIDAQSDVGPVNNWMHSLFSQVNISLNEKLISMPANTYAYRAFLENLLSYGKSAKASQLTSEMWYKDTSSHMEARTDDNAGFTKRKALIARSRIVDLTGKLHLDMFFQERYLLNGVDAKINLIRSKDAFALMATNDDFKIKIMDAALFVRKVRISNTVRMAHIKALERGTAKYPIKRIETKAFSVASGSMSINKENLFLGQMPKRIFVGLVDNDAYNGVATKNPFNFKHNNIEFLALYVDGQQIPAKPLQPNFGRSRFIRSYSGLFTGSGKIFHDEGNDISREEYGNGYTVFGFDLTPDLSEAGHFHLIKHGNLRLEIHFSQALAETVSVVVYAEFDNIIEIDRNRNVIFDFAT